MLQEVNEMTKNSNIVWAKISGGRIVVSADSSDPKAVSRTNKANNEVWERFYASIAGKITTLSVEDNKFGETDIKVGLEFGDKKGVLTFGLDSSYGRGFLNQIFNADLSKTISFTPWMKVTEEGTKRTNLYLNYGPKQSVEYKLPEGTPEVKWVETKKGKVIDPVSKADHDEFLEEKLAKFISENNLTYNNGLSSITSEEFLEMSKPLSEEEKAQLKKPSAEKVSRTSAQIIDDGDLDDLFNN
jgi:hypothetical protein